jgi:hypothetical protein
MLRFALTLASLMTVGSGLNAAPAPATPPATPVSGHSQLVELFKEWRSFNHPKIVDGRPDYGASAMSAKAARLQEFQQRLKAIDRTAGTPRRSGTIASSRPR